MPRSPESELFHARMDAMTWKVIAITFASALVIANVVLWVAIAISR